MVVCNVCQGDSFELQDGHYFCRLCHTQAEDWREEEMEVNYSQNTKLSIIMASFKSTEEDDAGDTTQRKEPADPGTWSTWEGLNSILVGQIREMEHLITLPKDFTFMAFNIWAKLLQNNGVCFTKMSFPVKAAKCIRDQKWVMQQKLHNRRNKGRRKRKKVESEDESGASSIRSANSLRTKLVNQQYISDTSATSSIVSTSISEFEDQASETESKSSLRSRHKDTKSIKLTRKTLLGVIYLALRLTNCKVQLFDLIRWLNYNHISYRWIEHMLPGESFLKGGDRELFGPKQSLLDRGTKSMVNLILTEAKHIHMILDYPYILPSDLHPLIPRLVRELCLPDELVDVISKLFLVAKPNLEFRPDISKHNYVPVAEIRVIAVVILVLKLLLGLDDLTEHQLSNWVDAEVNKLELFSWARWVEFTELRKTILADHFFWAKQMFNKQAVQTENNTFHLDPSFLPAYKNKESTALNCDKKRLLIDLSAKLLKQSVGSQAESAYYFSQSESNRPDPTKTLTPMADGIKIALENGSFNSMTEEVSKTTDSFGSSKYGHWGNGWGTVNAIHLAHFLLVAPAFVFLYH
ncbi:Hypothetical predicted protein [Cloeon dipterum]|uniref:TATA box-binding protein-associated factor RNA polymerase I subunit B n=1 Tax=Cloeon dipterum TaxID=197152 RepID=A0A8S1CHL5_9INSE|nr:Hypothetical predicted protein [Cloeon dipterum]